MKRLLLMLGVALLYTGLYAQECSDLFFSEYVEGSGNNKGVEIYNPTSQIVPLNNYYVARYSNGNLTYEAGGITRLQGFLEPYSTHFLVNGQTVSTETSPACDPALQAMAQQLDHDYPAPTYMNGNDAIALFKDPVGNGDVNDFQVVDLFGIIGGGMQSTDEGWASFTDAWVYKNIYSGDEIVGKDSVYIQHYIVPDSYYWIPWTANHSLVRKPSVKEGVKTNPAIEFVVTTEWDTVPGGVDRWDSIGHHTCDCQAATAVDNRTREESVTVFPNPASGSFRVQAERPIIELTLYDASGREVYHRNYEAGIVTARVRTEGLTGGVFLLKIRSRKETVMKRILIL